MLIILDEILANQNAVRSGQVLDWMRYAMGSQPWSNITVENPKTADHDAVVIGKQRKSDAVFVRKGLENFLGIITDGRDADAVFFQLQTGLFQLDQLGPAVASPIRAAMKYQQQSVGPG